MASTTTSIWVRLAGKSGAAQWEWPEGTAELEDELWLFSNWQVDVVEMRQAVPVKRPPPPPLLNSTKNVSSPLFTIRRSKVYPMTKGKPAGNDNIDVWYFKYGPNEKYELRWVKKPEDFKAEL